MRCSLTSLVIAGWMAISPVADGSSADTADRQKPVVASHATTGVVKSFDSRMLTISRAGAKRPDVVFELTASTHLEGTLVVGAPVSVRYRQDGASAIATAITVQQARTTPSARRSA